MDKKSYVKGLISAGLAFTIWGLLPLYWKLVKALSPYQIFAHRVVWSLIFIVIIMRFKNILPQFIRLVKVKKNWLYMFGPAFFISINWLTYIWSVNNGYVIESSLGYYMNPLVLTLFGGIFFKEKLDTLQKVGIGLATIGVIVKTVSYGQVPIIALVLAVSFAIYGLLKKQSQFSSLIGLGFETLIVGIPTLVYVVYSETSGMGISGNLPTMFWLLIATSGIVTAVPLLLYAEGAKRLPLTVVGFLQYVAPTIALFLGIFVFKEQFELKDFIPFAIIWVGLLCFSYSQIKFLRK